MGQLIQRLQPSRSVHLKRDPWWFPGYFGVVLLLVCAIRPSAFSQTSSSLKLQGEAQQAQAAGNDTLALSLYAKALQQSPTWTEGWWKYGGLLYQTKRFEDASGAFAHLIQLAPQNPLGFALLGLCEYEQADWNNASLHLNKALNHGGLPKEIADSTMYHFGLTLMHQKNRNGAVIMFRLLQHDAPHYPNLIPAIGSAELNLEAIPSPDAVNSAAVNLAGEAAIAVLELQPAPAEELYKKLVQQYPDLPFTHLCLALFLENLGRQSEAEQELKAETVVNHTTPDAWIWLGRLALARRDAVDARADVTQAIKLNPNDALCYLISGRSLMIDQQWDHARTELQRAELLAPDSYEVHYSLISVYTALHENEQAASERKLFAKTFAVSHPSDEVVHP